MSFFGMKYGCRWYANKMWPFQYIHRITHKIVFLSYIELKFFIYLWKRKKINWKIEIWHLPALPIHSLSWFDFLNSVTKYKKKYWMFIMVGKYSFCLKSNNVRFNILKHCQKKNHIKTNFSKLFLTYLQTFFSSCFTFTHRYTWILDI